MNNKNKTTARNILILAVVFLYFGALYILKVPCMFRELSGIACPFCGLTRSWISVFNFNFTQAFYYHPLFLFVPVFLIAVINYDKAKIYKILTISTAILFFAVYLLRLLFFTIP